MQVEVFLENGSHFRGYKQNICKQEPTGQSRAGTEWKNRSTAHVWYD